MVEELLQTLVCVVDTQLFERVVLNTQSRHQSSTDAKCVTAVKPFNRLHSCGNVTVCGSGVINLHQKPEIKQFLAYSWVLAKRLAVRLVSRVCLSVRPA